MNLNKYAIFLRGVNVGGNATVKMDVLKSALTENKYRDVSTHINSGNLIVSSLNDKEMLNQNITEIITAYFGIIVEMIIKTKNELLDIIENDPFDPEKETENSKKAVVMLSEKVDNDKVLVFKESSKIEENFYFKDDLLYIYYHNGAGRSKFTNNFIGKKLKVTATARNWNTILKMADKLLDK
jgi:uncharacterized protein (DUF1697 family)